MSAPNLPILQMNTYNMTKLLTRFFLAAMLISCNAGEKPNEEYQKQNELNEEEVEQESNMGELPMEYAEIITNKGKIVVELDPNAAPITTANFLSYVDEGFYDGTIFHRVIPNFMIQGGGFTPEGEKKETKSPIVLESDNGLSNRVGTIAMARMGAPNSATAQFYINVANNQGLDYNPSNPGYAVFGRVIEGMDVVNEIRQVKTEVKNGRPNWPKEDVIIEKITRSE